MTRQNFLWLALSISVSTGALLTGCGGGGSDISLPTRTVNGTLSLPAGFPVSPRELRVETAMGGQGVAADGTFSIPVSEGETAPTLTWVRSGENLLLMGFVAAGGTLSVRSTAVALLYFGLGGYSLPTNNKANLLALIDAHAATTALTNVMTTRLTASPTALNTEDPEIAATLKTAMDTLLAERPAPTRATQVPAASRATRAEGSALLVTSPNTLQSNLELIQGNEAQSIVVTNHSRRYCQVYVYETGNKQKGGAATTYTSAKVITTTRLKPTAALSVGSTIFGFYSGQTAFVPVSTDPIGLAMASGAEKTEFETVVLGASSIVTDPPIYSDPKYAGQVETWRESRRVLNAISWIVDAVLGLLWELWGVRDLVTSDAALEAAVASLRKLQGQAWLDVFTAVENGNTSLATQRFLKLCAQGDAESVLVLSSITAILSPALWRILERGTLKNSLTLITTPILKLFNAAGVLIGAGDLAAVFWDLAHGEPAERWSATLFTSDVTLSPASATITPGDSQTLTANVPAVPGTDLIYLWSLAGSNLATLTSTADGKSGTSIETKSPVVSLVTTPSTNGTITVTVQAMERDSGGALNSRGQASSVIKVNDDVPFGQVRVTFNGTTRLLPKLSTQKLSGTSGLAIGAMYQKMNAEFAKIDGLKLVLEFPTTTLTVGSTARLPDAYSFTLEHAKAGESALLAPDGAGTLTVTEVGDGYFGYTINLNLKGLLGSTLSGPATLKGWVTGY